MSTATLPRSSLFFNSRPLEPLSSTKTFFAQGKGADGADQKVLRVEGMPVFRSGTFRDSMGFQNTWESMHMREMVLHFNHLKDSGIFPDVPVRAGHPSFLGGNPVMELIGYISDLRTETRTSPIDGKEYDYLVADYDIFDEAAQAKINSTLWRNRSSEIGTYVTNDEAEYAPTFMGVAYVDIPAVEGLSAFAKGNGDAASPQYSIMMEESEMPMPKPQPPAGAETKDADTTPAPPAPPAPEPHAFSMNGTSTTDFAAVQAYITSLEASNTELEKFRTDTLAAQREDFVKGLAAANKIGANQIDSYNKFAKDLSDEQYAAWTATFDAAQPQSLLQNHGSQTPADADPDAGSGDEPKGDPLTVPKAVIRQLHAAKVSTDKIKRTAQYSQIISADKSFDLAAFLRSAK